MVGTASERPVRLGLWRPALILLLVVTGLGLARALGVSEQLGESLRWIESLGAWSAVVFVLLCAAANVAALPGSPFTFAAGVLFGPVWGVVAASVGSTLGAGLAFLIGRRFARDAVARRLSSNHRFRQLDRLVRNNGAVVVVATRLASIFPAALLNYGFALTGVPFRAFVFWSWLGMLPATMLIVVGSAAAARGLSEGRPPWELAPWMAAFGVLLVGLAWRTRRRLTSDDGAPQTDQTNRLEPTDRCAISAANIVPGPRDPAEGSTTGRGSLTAETADLPSQDSLGAVPTPAEDRSRR